MRKFLLSLFLVAICFVVNAQNRVYNDLKNTYYYAFRFDKIEVTPTQTVADITVEYYPNNWLMIPSGSYLVDNNGKRYKLLKSDDFPLNKRNFMPASGVMNIKFYFEPIGQEAESLDFIDASSNNPVSTYGILIKGDKQYLPDTFLGDWLTIDGRNKFVYGLHEKVALMDNKIWDYSSVQKKGSSMEIVLRCGDEVKKIVAKLSKNGNLLCGADNKSLVECSRDFTESEKANPNWSFLPEKYHETIYTSGKVVLRGYLSDYTPKLGFKVINVRMNDLVTNKDNSTLIEIQPDGRFEAEIELEHPVYMLNMELRTNIYLSPGDTILMSGNIQSGRKPVNTNSRTNSSLRYMGSVDGADINNLSAVIKSKIGATYTDYRQMQISCGKGIAEVKECKDKLLKDIQAIRDSADIVFSHYVISDRVKDQIFTDMIVDKFTSLFNVKMFHDDTKFISSRGADGNYAMTPNENFVPLKGYYDYMTDFQSSVLDNPLVICSASTWVPFNRFEYSDPFCRNPRSVVEVAHRTKVFGRVFEKKKLEFPDSLRNALNTFIEGGYVREKDMKRGGQIIFDIYTKYSNLAPDPRNMTEKESAYIMYQMLSSFGLNKSVMYDYAIARSVANTAKQERISTDYLLEHITSLLPYIKTPYITKKMMQIYAQSVQPSIAVTSSNPKADEIFERLIAPYKGNVLVIDFWSTGCGPCRAGMLSSREMVDRLKDKKIKFLYITDETQSPIDTYTKFLSENNIKGEQIRVTQDEWNYLSIKFNISGIPHHALVNKEGKIISHKASNADDERYLLELERK